MAKEIFHENRKTKYIHTLRTQQPQSIGCVFILIRRFAFIFGRQHRFLYWYADGIDVFLYHQRIEAMCSVHLYIGVFFIGKL